MRPPEIVLIGTWPDKEPLAGYPGKVQIVTPGTQRSRVSLHRAALISATTPCILLDGKHEAGPGFDWEAICDGIASIMRVVTPDPGLLLLNGWSGPPARCLGGTTWRELAPDDPAIHWPSCSAYYVPTVTSARALIVASQSERNLPWLLSVAARGRPAYGSVTDLFVKDA